MRGVLIEMCHVFGATFADALAVVAARGAGALSVVWLQGDENVLERLWRYSDPVRQVINRTWKLGTVEFTFANLVLGVAIFVVALLVSRWLRALLARRMERHKRLDPGVQYTVLRLVNYVVIVVGVLYGLKTAFGLDLTSIAVVFTALSVGIGFGLQFIAGDIASGFILLFERPVRIGDFVSVSGPDGKMTEGRVSSINLRTTVVVTNDNISAIVPNSKLVNQNLINWSYAGRRARISIPVGVSYDADVKLVTETLLSAAEGVNFVLEEPKPSVQFLGFGDFALNFRLLVWTERPRRHPQIKSDINYNIHRLFKEAHIEIPFPRHDLNLRGGPIRIEGADDGGATAGDDGDGDSAETDENRASLSRR